MFSMSRSLYAALMPFALRLDFIVPWSLFLVAMGFVHLIPLSDRAGEVGFVFVDGTLCPATKNIDRPS